MPQVPQAPYGLRLGKDNPAPDQQVRTGCYHRTGDGRARPAAQSRGRARLGCGSIPWQPALGLLLTKPKADSYRTHLEQLLFVSAAVPQDKVRVFGLGMSRCMWLQ